MGFSARPRVRFGDGDVYQLRIVLEGIDPLVWRRVAISARASLDELHQAIQRCFGHEETSGFGYRFEVDGVDYLDPDDGPEHGHATDEIACEQLGLHVGARFRHVAECHGDGWTHGITVEQVTPRLVGQRLPTCLAAERAAPPEYCSGVREYRALLEVLQDPHDPRSGEWPVEKFDPGYVDVVAINAMLAKLKRSRPAA